MTHVGSQRHRKRSGIPRKNLMFMDPCIIVKFIKKNTTRCNNVSKYYYSIFIWSSTCFGRNTVHHQEPKTAVAASGFSYVEGCWTCSWWTLSGTASYKNGIIKFRYISLIPLLIPTWYTFFYIKLHKIKFLYMFRASAAHLQEVNDVNCTCMQPLVFSFSFSMRIPEAAYMYS